VLNNSSYSGLVRERYASFDSGEGQAFEAGKLQLKDLRKIAQRDGEPQQRSGRQELFENLLSRFV
jgi:xylose isomerase